MTTPSTKSLAVHRTAPRPFASRNHFGRRFSRPRKISNGRQGIAVVEVAICLPILLLVTLLFIEFTNFIFLRQSLKVASYEGVRVAIKQGAQLTDVVGVCSPILDSREVVEYEISVEPQDFSEIQRGTLVTVTIEVDKNENQLFGLLLIGESTVEVQSYGLKE